MHPVKLIGRATGTAVHTIRHPISSAAYAAGLARGLAGAAVHGTLVKRHDADAGPADTPGQDNDALSPASPRASAPDATDTAGPREPQVVPKPVPPPDATFDTIVIEAADSAPGESFATEPKAVSRESAHGGGSAINDAEIDAWIDEAMEGLDTRPDIDIETPVGTTGAGAGYNPDTAEADLQQPGTQPVLDPATAKAILKEAETLRKAADPDKG